MRITKYQRTSKFKMILGISLVVNELNKGQRMVFRYPESIPAVVENGPNKGLVKLYNQYFSFR